MSHTKEYINSFGELTDAQKKIVTKSYGYASALLADKLEAFKKEVKKQIIKDFKIFCRLINKTKKGGNKMISQEFLCKCKKQKGWITEGKETSPCPHCGRTYFSQYNVIIGIEASEIGRKNEEKK